MNKKLALLLLQGLIASTAYASAGEYLCGQRGEITVELHSGWNKIQIVSANGVGNYVRSAGMTYQLEEVISNNPQETVTLSNCKKNPGDE